MESACDFKHAINTFTPDALGEGNDKTGGSKLENVSRSSTALLAVGRGSHQVRRMIGNGSRKRVAKRWSRRMGLLGRRRSRNGCRTCWAMSVAMRFPRSCTTRHAACSLACPRCMCQGPDRSRGSPQSRTGNCRAESLFAGSFVRALGCHMTLCGNKNKKHIHS